MGIESRDKSAEIIIDESLNRFMEKSVSKTGKICSFTLFLNINEVPMKM